MKICHFEPHQLSISMTDDIIKMEKKLNLQRIEKVIQRIRESFSNSVEVYTQGSCYKFAMILKEIYPYGKILTNQSHAIFELEDGKFYDITGMVKKEDHTPLVDEGCNFIYDRLSLKYSGYVS